MESGAAAVTQHARIGLSSLDRTVACHGWIQLAEQVEELPRTPEQIEGDAGHWVACEAANGRHHGVGYMTPHGIPVDEDMVEGAQMWVETVGLYGITEMPMIATSLHPTECWGTPDWQRFDPIVNTLRVAEYKYGFRYVEVFENWQLFGQAQAILDTMGVSLVDDPELLVEFMVVQPRSYHKDGPVRRWTIPARELVHMSINGRHACHMSLMPNPTTRVGTHCEFCPARHVCTTLQRAASSIVEFLGQADPVNLPASALATELRILADAETILKARKTGLEQQAQIMLRDGKLVPGFALERSTGRRIWNHDAPAEEIAFMGDMMGKQLRKPLQLVTPTQAIKEHGIDEAVISQYSFRPPGSVKLTRETTNHARKVFGVNQS